MILRAFLAAFAACALLLGGPGDACAAASRSIPFEFLQERQILLPVRINGRPAEAWLDSGASMTILDAALAERLGISTQGEVRAQGVARRMSGVRLATAGLQIGALNLPRRRVAVTDLSALSQAAPRPVEIILGRDVFDEAIVDIDFRARRIILSPKTGFAPPPHATPLPLRRLGVLRGFPITIGGARTTAVLDLGNAGSLMLDRGFAEAFGLLKGRRVSTQMSFGADGAHESGAVSLDGVRLDGAVFDDVPADLVLEPASKAAANVGLGLLSRFRVTVDFSGSRLWLRPYPDAARRPFRKNRTGLTVLREGDGLRVRHVAKGSPAEAAGWREGELIVQVDGRSAAAAPELGRFSFGPPGRTVILTLQDGASRTLELADYY